MTRSLVVRMWQLTGCLDEGLVVLSRKERIRQVPEELLEQSGDAVHVVEKVLRIPEVQAGGA
jgi:hypothetical protein